MKDDTRMRLWAGRYATYSGSSPYEAPATLACIAAVEADHGSWYVGGGIGALRDAVVTVAQRIGVHMRTGVEGASITTRRRRVAGVVTTSGERIDARVVVANVDAEHLYRDLLPQPKEVERVRKAGRSTSGIVVLVGVEGKTPLVAHHNVWFSRDYAREFADLAAGRIPDDPTVYACVSSVTDPSQAPAGCENWFLLVNAPADVEVDADTYGPRLLDHLASIGPDLRARARFVETIGPRDIAARYRAPGGAIYGTSSNGRSAAFRRPTNTGAVRGVYLVGGSSHPGGGLPMVTASARIASELILRHRRDR
jgi:phytoene desaturase